MQNEVYPILIILVPSGQWYHEDKYEYMEQARFSKGEDFNPESRAVFYAGRDEILQQRQADQRDLFNNEDQQTPTVANTVR
jgi:hypothetical protein